MKGYEKYVGSLMLGYGLGKLLEQFNTPLAAAIICVIGFLLMTGKLEKWLR